MGRAYQNRKESMAKTAAAKPKSTAKYVNLHAPSLAGLTCRGI